MSNVHIIVPLFPSDDRSSVQDCWGFIPANCDVLDHLEARLEQFGHAAQQYPDLKKLTYNNDLLEVREIPESSSRNSQEARLRLQVIQHMAEQAEKTGEGQLLASRWTQQLPQAQKAQELELHVQKERLRWKGERLPTEDSTAYSFQTSFIGRVELLLGRMVQSPGAKMGSLFQDLSQLAPQRALEIVEEGVSAPGLEDSSLQISIREHLEPADFSPLLDSPHTHIRRWALRLMGQMPQQEQAKGHRGL